MFLKAAKAKDIDPTEEFLRMAAYIYSDKCAESFEPGTSEPTEGDANLEDDELDIEDVEIFDEWRCFVIQIIIKIIENVILVVRKINVF